jgi:hypothetical protein
MGMTVGGRENEGIWGIMFRRNRGTNKDVDKHLKFEVVGASSSYN